MKNVQEYFCSYDQTEELLKLGMKFMPMCSYKIGDKESIFLNHLEADDEFYVATKEGYFPAPLKSQAFDFFRENFGLHSEVRYADVRYADDVLQYWYLITEIKTNTELYEGISKFTYEGAKSSCINKLIELAKQQKQCQI